MVIIHITRVSTHSRTFLVHGPSEKYLWSMNFTSLKWSQLALEKLGGLGKLGAPVDCRQPGSTTSQSSHFCLVFCAGDSHPDDWKFLGEGACGSASLMKDEH